MTLRSSKCKVGVWWVAAAALAVIAPCAKGTLVAGGTGEQTSGGPPPGIPGYNNVALIGDGAGIYLGDRWMLSANHVDGGLPGAWTATFNGQTYAQDLSTPKINLTNPNGTTADFSIRRLATAPNLPSLVIGGTPAIGTSITTVGWGVNRATSPTVWYYNASNNSIAWSETPGPTRPNSALGYKWGTTRAKRWGTNVTEAMATDGNGQPLPLLYATVPGGGTTQLFGSEFTNNGSTTEGTVADNDSGGAVFDSRNRLIGVSLYTYYFEGQPNHTSVFGDYAFYGNLATYADQIASQTHWAPSILGDANLDGSVDGTDFKILYAHYGTGSK